ncbi:PD-(D/E)XK nuclease family protein [Marinilactibacillus kalidii]|uniref:PD-(D/E)XK nuclease family protein n=1 Tax=Marinilactibacillus kalidii TaxID=2820274 RepID=UPI001ABE0CFB|nr:PD-(D/E)XK nuclease family protein [Marinilactibacillus kalidii]
MSLQFVIGRADTEKESALIKEMNQLINQDNQAQVFYLVPDHIKFETEINVLKQLKDIQDDSKAYTGMINLQVFSFSRLAWYYLQDTAIYNQTQLTETGLTMLVKKLVKDYESALSIFRGESAQQGFIEKLTTLFMEMRNGRINLTDLEQLTNTELEQSLGGNDFSQKIADIQLLYQAFNEQLINQYIEKEDILAALIEALQKKNLSQTTIYINHYQSFSAQEQALIIELVRHCKDVHVALVLDQKFAVEPPLLTHFFYETGMTYYRLYQLALQEHLPVLNDQIISDVNSERCQPLNDLAQFWIDSSTGPMNPATQMDLSMDECIEIWSAETKQAEILHVSNKIRKMVTEEGYRYKDIMIMSRDIDAYKTVIEPLFQQNELALFIDEPDAMSGHPLVELIQSLLLISKRHWRYEDVMRFLRTELFVPHLSDQSLPKELGTRLTYLQEAHAEWRTKVDLTENVILAYGYEGSAWTRDQEWIYARYQIEDMNEQFDNDKQIQATANQVRTVIRETLLPFFKKIKKATTNRDAARLLYQFLNQHSVDDQIVFWRDQALAAGDLVEARKHEQVWETFINMLDEFVDVLGDEPWSMDDFLAILETGFEQAKYSIVPPSIDQVIFTSFDKVRASTKKVVFIVGLTDQLLPLNRENDSILTDEDREKIQTVLPLDRFLAPTTESVMASEPLSAYMAFRNASDKLIFSYPVKQEGNGNHRISPYIKRIADHLSITVQPKLADSHLVLDQSLDTILSFIGSRKQSIGQLNTILREGIDQDLLPHTFWLSLFEQLRDKDNFFENRVFHSLERKNIPVPLTNDLAEQLYGKDLYLSVSQLESFYLDPYSHFLQYGLRLKERSIQELTPTETGNFFHDALDQLFKLIVSKDLSVQSLDDEMLRKLTDEVLNNLYEKNQFRLLSMSNRMKFIRDQLGKTVKRMMWAITNQSKRSKSTPQKSEVLFGRIGQANGIPGLAFPLNNGGQIHVRGKIDRLDTMEIEKQLYVSIVDYKSSKHSFKYDELFYGLMMQMITYLDTAVEFSPDLLGQKARPAGAFYAQVKNPYLKSLALDTDEWMEALLKEFKLNGLAINNEDVLSQLDLTMEPGNHSLVYPINQLKNGTLKGRALITTEELDLLVKHNRQLIIEAGNQILTGKNMLMPFMEKRQFTPSVSGPYKAISQFDVLLEENNYRHFEDIPDKKALIHRISNKLILPGEAHS